MLKKIIIIISQKDNSYVLHPKTNKYKDSNKPAPAPTSAARMGTTAVTIPSTRHNTL